jgi:hypothetical protein
MLSNKWHFIFDEGTHRICFGIYSWDINKEQYLQEFYKQYSERHFILMFEMIETAYLLSLIEVKN